MCRLCKKHFDREIEKENEYWVMPSRNYYYHKDCYDNWQTRCHDLTSQLDEQKWKLSIYDYLAYDLKVKYDFLKCQTQMENFVKKYKYTYKGMLFALKYYYEVEKGDWTKSGDGVGILPYIYDRACSYWEEKYLEDNKIIENIEKQILERLARPKTVVYKPKQAKSNKLKTYNFEDIESEE